MAKYDRVLKGGMVVDGTRAPRYRADIGVKDGRIAEIGQIDPADAEETLDVFGRERIVVAREHARGRYDAMEYVLAKLITELPLDAACVAVLVMATE